MSKYINSKTQYLIVLALLISFGSIGAVAFTPGLPLIAEYFKISNQAAQSTITWYLAGYAFGQLLYGPLANRYGSRATIAIGAILEIIGSLGCICAYPLYSFTLLLASRVIMALGASSGLKMTFTLSSKLFTTSDSARYMGLLTMAFAITPGLGVFIGGILVSNFNWTAPFVFMAIYGVVILILNRLVPEIYKEKNYQSLKVGYLIKSYSSQFKNINVICGGLLVGLGSAIVYIFAALAPFMAINTMHVQPSSYGIYNFIPSVGILIGSLSANHLGKFWRPQKALKFGLFVALIGSIILLTCLTLWGNYPVSLFLPMLIIYFGLSFIFGNSAALALHNIKDTSNASAIMSFLNMGQAFLIVMLFGFFSITQTIILPLIYIGLISFGVIWYRIIRNGSLI